MQRFNIYDSDFVSFQENALIHSDIQIGVVREAQIRDSILEIRIELS
jgi:hypothetical protein